MLKNTKINVQKAVAFLNINKENMKVGFNESFYLSQHQVDRIHRNELSRGSTEIAERG